MWTHFPLHPETPAGGASLEELFAGRDVDVAAMQARMRGLMEQEGLPYGERTHTYNSRLAQELGKWAETQNGGAAFHDVLFRAYFVEALDISDIDVLVASAEQAGLDASEARHVLTTRQFQAAIDVDWQRARAFDITGVPTFVSNGRGVVGAQPYEVLEQLVVLAGGIRRDETPG